MPNSQFTIYTSADSGSVVLNGTSGSLIALLDQCLVSGSASKPACGWTKPFANSSNLGCWTQATGSLMTLFINDSVPNTKSLAQSREAWATGWESLSVLGGPCGTGSGQFPTPDQVLTSGHVVVRKTTSADSLTRPWVLYADSSSFYLFIQTGDTTVAGCYNAFFFGDVFSLAGTSDIWKCMIQGRVVENSTAATAGQVDNSDVIFAFNATTTTYFGHYIARTAGGRGNSLQVYKMGDASKTALDLVSAEYMVGIVGCPNPVDNSIYLSPVLVCEPANKSIRGRMRGMYHICHPLTSFGDGQIIYGANDFAGKTFQVVKPGYNSGMWAIEISNTVETN